MIAFEELIINGFIEEIISNCIDISWKKIKESIVNKNDKNIESQIYDITVNVINQITNNKYRSNQDRVCQAAEKLLVNSKNFKYIDIECVKSGLCILDEDVDDNEYKKFKLLLYQEISKDKYKELYRQIRLLQEDENRNKAFRIENSVNEIKQEVKEVKQIVLDGERKNKESNNKIVNRDKLQDNKEQKEYIRDCNNKSHQVINDNSTSLKMTLIEKGKNKYYDNNLISQDINYAENQNKDFEIIGGVLVKYKGESIDVIIPDNVLIIGENVFARTFIKSVKMTNVIEIGSCAFQACRNLQSIYFSPCLQKIGYGSFNACISLESIEFPNAVEHIDEYAFCYCTQLNFSNLPNRLTYLGSNAFMGCENIDRIVFPESLDLNSKSQTLGEKNLIFEDCLFREVVLPSNFYNPKPGMFKNCKRLKYVKLHNGIKFISYQMFYGCDNLKSIELPNSVEEIYREAFKKSGIEKIDIPSSVKVIGHGAFTDVKLVEIRIPEFCKVYGGYDDGDFYHEAAFQNCKKLKEVQIPKSAVIDKSAFAGCNNLFIPQLDNGGCYIATCVYGSYDCPEVWTLRRFRDNTLNKTWYGKVFIKWYYVVSPVLVNWFGGTKYFRNFWKIRLDKIVFYLNKKGIKDTYYSDEK